MNTNPHESRSRFPLVSIRVHSWLPLFLFQLFSFSAFSFSAHAATLSGTVTLPNFSGATRSVHFVATGGATAQHWTLSLPFSAGAASFTLPDVPAGTTHLSAKTDWHLRQRLSTINTPTINFALSGGDLNSDNVINWPDYGILAQFYMSTNPVADITGDGVVNFTDYSILAANYYTAGDPE